MGPTSKGYWLVSGPGSVALAQSVREGLGVSL